MSGIAGICNLDGRPVERARLQRMTDAIAYRGPDGVACWIDGATGLGHAMLHTTVESLREVQPLSDAQSALCLTLDGRVDNRDELRAALQSKGLAPKTDTDAELVLRAYQCWGEDCPQRILGDFAFAIWDGRKRTLFCARDALGIKPFYYYADQRVFIFGSELQQLFEGADIPCEPNEGMIGEYLANAITSREETLYQGILRLPPAHCLRVQDGRLQLSRYWNIDAARSIRYRSDAEYAEHFLEIFTQAVKCRLRSHTCVGVELSGGLDSSSVVSLIRKLQRDGAVSDIKLETFSLVFPGMACDESTYIDEVIRNSGASYNLLPPFEPGASCNADYVRRHRDFPGYPNNYLWNTIRAAARDKGFRVHITGMGGDDWLTGSEMHYTELLRHLKIRDLARGARTTFQEAAVSGGLSKLYLDLRTDLLAQLPPAAIRTIRRTLGLEGVPAWISPQFARRNHLRDRLARKPSKHRFSNYAQRELYGWLNGGYLPHAFEYDDRSAAEYGFEMRHPLHDRRIVDFAFAVPQDQLWRHKQTKFVLRQAMRGVLPEAIDQRADKADFSHAVGNAFKAQGGARLFDSLAIASANWVDKTQIDRMYRQMYELYANADEEYSDYIWPPWMIFGIDLWYRMSFLNRRVSIGAGPDAGHYASFRA